MKIALLCCILLWTRPARSQCFATALHDAATFSTDNAIGIYDFSSPSSAAASDNNRAVASSLVSLLSGDTYYLKATNFNFSIPSYASICGVTVEIESRATGLLLTAAVRDNSVRLIKNGVITGNDKAQPGDWSGTESYKSYGGPADLWGESLSPEDVNDPGFGVAISASIIALIAALPTAQIDHIRMLVHYNPVLPVHLGYFDMQLKDGHALATWNTLDEEEGGMIVLERMQTGIDPAWKERVVYRLTDHTPKSYCYTDLLDAGCSYIYRLKLINAAGKLTYSASRYISKTSSPPMAVYPNPAIHTISIRNRKVAGPVRITDINGKEVMAFTDLKAGAQINISGLAPGIYILHGKGQALRWVKR